MYHPHPNPLPSRERGILFPRRKEKCRQSVLDDKGLAPAICQHAETGEVIMLGYINPRRAEAHSRRR